MDTGIFKTPSSEYNIELNANVSPTEIENYPQTNYQGQIVFWKLLAGNQWTECIWSSLMQTPGQRDTKPIQISYINYF